VVSLNKLLVTKEKKQLKNKLATAFSHINSFFLKDIMQIKMK